jgi:hypothetical protein
MRKIALAVAVMFGLPALAGAQTSVSINIGLPIAPPRLVVVSPGIQVVPEFHEEVFFSDGFYWVRRDQVWYHSRVHTGGWVVVPGGRVPPGLARIPPGKYKKWKPAGHPGGGHPGRGGGDHGGGKHKKGKH